MKQVRLQQNTVTIKTRLFAPFVERYRARVGISKIPEPMRSILFVTMQSDDGKLVFVKNSKAGCTTVANVIYHYSKGKFLSGIIHRERKNFRQGIEHFRENLIALNNPNCMKFTFVRHPESRVLSAFKDFFVERKNPAAAIHIAEMKHFGFDIDNQVVKNFEIFLDYLGANFEIDLQLTDQHFRLQTLNIGLGHVNYDFVGRVENFDDDLRKAFVLAGATKYLTDHPGFGQHNRTKKSDFTMGPQQRKKIEDLYAPDYEAFNYH